MLHRRARSAPSRRRTDPARPAPRRRLARLALGTALTGLLTALLLVVPVAGGGANVVSELLGLTASTTAPDRTSSPEASRDGDRESPVIMGVDGLAGLPSPTGTPTTEPPAPAPAPDPTTSAPSTAPATTEEPTTAPPSAEAAPAPAPTAAATPAPAAAPAGAAGQVLALVNQERAAAGCGAVVPDGALAAVAQAHSADMRDRGFFSHTNPDGLDPFDRAAAAGLSARAENIAYGQPDAAAVMTAWMNSAGHRANILDCGLTRLGVGVAEGGDGPYWTQLFA